MDHRSDNARHGSEESVSDDRVDTSSHDHTMANQPMVNWLLETIFYPVNRTEHVQLNGAPNTPATPNAPTNTACLGFTLFDRPINLLPSFALASIRHIFEQDGRYGGWRRKSGTWPLSKQESLLRTMSMVAS